MTATSVQDLAELVTRLEALPYGPRPILVAIAGAPGSGKSSLAEAIHSRIDRTSCVIPMDGFHLDNDTLRDRALMHRKGAPQTFDLHGLRQLVAALRSNSARGYPTFDRAADRTVPDGGVVPEGAELLLIEGNYLLLDEPGWRDLRDFWDASIWLDVSEAILMERLVRRWRDHGLPVVEARQRAEQNDIANARHVIQNRLQPTWIVGPGS